VLVAFEEPVLMAKVEFECEVTATLLAVVLPWKKIPPLELAVVEYEGVAVFAGSDEIVVEYTERGVLVANAGREDPWGRVTQRLGRGISRRVVTTAGLTPMLLKSISATA
jgi:hypothetical protein